MRILLSFLALGLMMSTPGAVHASQTKAKADHFVTSVYFQQGTSLPTSGGGFVIETSIKRAKECECPCPLKLGHVLT
ncbi:MAG: hypothetical protein HRU11_04405 [Parvularculaceae bacterium]|nr:hypothetical protein [Parvularculaceae bacterium]